ncbi:MAG: hypothetical protein FWH29_06670 [Methanobrevibacter sp.]|nr:hypothetical protein [Methanobrevibacter sp.]
MQKNKNQNKFMILLIAFILLFLAIVSSLGAVSATVADTSYVGVYIPRDSPDVTNGVYQWDSGLGYDVLVGYTYTWGYDFVTTPNGADRPYNNLDNAYSAASSGDGVLEIATGNPSSNTLNINSGEDVIFSHWTALPTRPVTIGVPQLTTTTGGAGTWTPGTNPLPLLYRHTVDPRTIGATTNLSSVTVTSTASGVNTFSGSDLHINGITIDSGNSGTQIFSNSRIVNITSIGGTQNFTNNVVVNGTANFTGGIQNFNGPTTTFSNNNVIFNGSTPNFNSLTIFHNTIVNITADYPPFNFTSNVNFNGNTIINNSGGDYHHNFTGVNITGNPATDNFIFYGDGAEFYDCNSTIPVYYYPQDGTFDGCNFTNGFNLYGSHGNYEYRRCTFNDSGGYAFYIDPSNPNTIIFINVTFRDSIVGLYNPFDSGHVFGDNCVVTLINCSLYNNTHAIVNEGNLIIRDGTRIFNNNGTAIILNGTSQNTTISGSFIENNTKNVTGHHNNNHGGAISISFGELYISNTSFFNNSVTFFTVGNGGAIYQTGGNIYLIPDFETINNTNVSVEYCTIFDLNNATYGGAIYSENGRIEGFANFTRNNATHGGAIYLNGSNLIFTNEIQLYSRLNTSIPNGTAKSKFEANTATDGGALYHVSGNVTGFAEYVSNIASNSGGAIYSNNSSFSISGLIHYNSAPFGAGIYHDVINGSLTLVGNTQIENNNATIGGGIYSGADNITGGTIQSNTATTHGGGLYSNNTNLTLFNQLYDNNRAPQGGGIYHDVGSGNITFNNTNITNNHANGTNNGYGGGLHTGANNITGGNFTGNHANIVGGAIYANNTNVSLRNGYFDGNYAPNGGGVFQDSITSNPVELNVNNSTFINNYATSGNGGGIYSNASTVTINESNFGNSATNGNNATTGDGGAIYHGDGTLLSVISSNFNGNRAINGGGVYSNALSVNIDDSTYSNNVATTHGGAIYSSNNTPGSNLTVTGGSFNNNRANDTTGNGGAIYTEAEEVIVSNVINGFNGNSANNGGAIVSNNNNAGSTLTVFGSTFSNNRATNMGGAVFSNSVNDTYNNDLIENGNATYGGGIYYNGSDSLNILNSTIRNNNASINGGGVYTNTTDDVLIADSTIRDNIAGSNGGGVFYGKNGTITIINGTVRNNNATTLDGGGLWTNASNVTVEISIFDDNYAGRNGGGIYYTEDGVFSINSTYFNNNSAVVDGGGIFTNTTNFSVIRSWFNYNHAGQDGGGIHYNNSVGMFNVTNLTYNGNTAGRDGGGVHTNVVDFYVTDSRFYGNGADRGGGIFFYGDTLHVNNTTYRGNTARSYGGGLWTDSCNVSITDLSEFIANYAGVDGGAIYQNCSGNNSNFTIDNSILSDNYARRDGGAMWASGININITNNSILKSNTAGRFGGAYFNVNNNSILLISNSTLNFNYANQGGAVYTNALTSLITRSILNGNYAYNTAGAVYQFGNGYLTIGHSNLTGNEAYYSAGAVYTSVGTTIEYSTFTNSVARNFYGGAIYNVNEELRVFFSEFIGNTAMVYGAAIYNAVNCRLVVARSEFINNTGVITSNKANYALVNIEDQVGAIANFGRAEITGAYFTGNALCIADYGNMFVTQSNFTSNRWALLLAGTNSHIFTNTFVGNNLFANVTTAGKENVINYNRIVVPFGGKALFNYGFNTDADYNWWGQNNFTNLIYGINLKNWFVMYIQTDIQPQNFVNPGQTLYYTYYFELNTKDPWNRNYLPEFYALIDHNSSSGTFDPWLATNSPRTWRTYFGTTDYFYVLGILDNEVSGFNVNDYTTILKVGKFNTRVGETVNLTATLTDAYGTPMVYRKVSFYLNGTLIGSAHTNLDGVAHLLYKVTRPGIYPVNAYFNGDNYTSGYYIVDPPLTGEGWYRPRASASGFWTVTNDSIRISARFDYGNVSASRVNVSSIIGSQFDFLYTIRNLNASAVDLAVKFVIPAGLNYVKAIAYYQNGTVINNASISNIVFDKKTNTLTWYVSASKDDNVSINITLKSSKRGKYAITPEITSKDANLNVSAGRISVTVYRLPDLVITRVKKVNGLYRITIKNNGDLTANKTRLLLICGCKEYNHSVSVKALAGGKSATYELKFPAKGRDHVKYARVNYEKKAVESNYKNNVYKVGKI